MDILRMTINGSSYRTVNTVQELDWKWVDGGRKWQENGQKSILLKLRPVEELVWGVSTEIVELNSWKEKMRIKGKIAGDLFPE